MSGIRELQHKRPIAVDPISGKARRFKIALERLAHLVPPLGGFRLSRNGGRNGARADIGGQWARSWFSETKPSSRCSPLPNRSAHPVAHTTPNPSMPKPNHPDCHELRLSRARVGCMTIGNFLVGFRP
jgi:hypothetical protein